MVAFVCVRISSGAAFAVLVALEVCGCVFFCYLILFRGIIFVLFCGLSYTYHISVLALLKSQWISNYCTLL